MEDKNGQSLVFIESVNMFHFTNSSRDYLYPPTPAVQIKQAVRVTTTQNRYVRRSRPLTDKSVLFPLLYVFHRMIIVPKQ